MKEGDLQQKKCQAETILFYYFDPMLYIKWNEAK
jgi:hypothetical protein